MMRSLLYQFYQLNNKERAMHEEKEFDPLLSAEENEEEKDETEGAEFEEEEEE